MLAGCLLLFSSLCMPAQAQREVSPNDPIFLRWPELRQAYFRTAETKVASHKYIAMPMPKQCAFFYAAAFSDSRLSDRDVREKSVRDCNTRLQELGALHENYAVECACRAVVGRDKYRLDFSEMPSQFYAPFALFYRDRQGGTARLYGHVEVGVPPRSGAAELPITVFNGAGQPVCSGTVNAMTGLEGNYTLDCLRGTVVSRGIMQAHKRNVPLEHSVARATSAQGQPTVVVIGLPSQLAYDLYGRL